MVASLSLFGLFLSSTIIFIIVNVILGDPYPKNLCILSSSGFLNINQSNVLNNTITFLREKNYNVKLMPNTYKGWNAFAGTDEQRVSDLQQALEDPENCSIILFSRGGYGFTRSIDKVNWRKVNDKRREYAKQHPTQHPLRIVGYSDVTHILVRVAEQKDMNYLSIHGPMPAFTDFVEPDIFNRIEKLLEVGNVPSISGAHSEHNRQGEATGEMVGGNLSILDDSIGTETEFDTKGKILFLEEVSEPTRRIDRMIRHLGRAGKFNEIKGLVLGQFTDCTNDNYFPSPIPIPNVIAQALQPFIEGKTYPIGYNFNFGHGNPNLALPLGRPTKLTVGSTESTLSVL